MATQANDLGQEEKEVLMSCKRPHYLGDFATTCKLYHNNLHTLPKHWSIKQRWKRHALTKYLLRYKGTLRCPFS